jgi:hypothetical protein
MSMTVRELIEHLAQYEPDLQVMVRDLDIPTAFHSIKSHSVELERVGDDIFNDSKMVVVLG